MRSGVVAVICLAAVASTTGCGGASHDAAGTTAAAAGGGGAITIEAPADGARLKARATTSGALRAPARVRGRAPAGSTVVLTASCRPAPCRAQASADGAGRWAVTLRLTTSRVANFVTIDANAQRDVVASGSAVATVELVGPARPRARTARARRAPSAPAAGGAPAEIPAPSRRALPHDVLVIGDSLALGIEARLRNLLPGWRVRVDGRIGRPLAEGMGILARQSAPPAILAFSLFTNDDPRNTRALAAAVRATAQRPGNCVVWSTVVRPPLNGVSYDAANALLAGLASDPRLARSLELVDWAAAVAQSPSLVSPQDGVHGTPEGYRVLAQLYAEAIERCAGG